MSSDPTPEEDRTATEAIDTGALDTGAIDTEAADVVSADAGTSGADGAEGTPAASRIEAKRAAREAAAAPAAGGREFTVTAGALRAALLALLAIIALVVIGLLSWQYVAKSRTLNAFADSKAASTEFITTYFETMMTPGATPEQVKEKIVPLTTGEARDRVAADAETNTKWATDAKFSNPKLVVNSATVESFTANSATTVLAATFTVSSAAEPAGAQQVFLLQLDMVRQDGKWLVGRMIPVPGISSSDAPGAQSGAGVAPAPTPEPAPAPEPAPGG